MLETKEEILGRYYRQLGYQEEDVEVVLQGQTKKVVADFKLGIVREAYLGDYGEEDVYFIPSYYYGHIEIHKKINKNSSELVAVMETKLNTSIPSCQKFYGFMFCSSIAKARFLATWFLQELIDAGKLLALGPTV